MTFSAPGAVLAVRGRWQILGSKSAAKAHVSLVNLNFGLDNF